MNIDTPLKRSEKQRALLRIIELAFLQIYKPKSFSILDESELALVLCAKKEVLLQKPADAIEKIYLLGNEEEFFYTWKVGSADKPTYRTRTKSNLLEILIDNYEESDAEHGLKKYETASYIEDWKEMFVYQIYRR